MRALIQGLCVATSISVGSNTVAWAGDCVEFAPCDAVIELEGAPHVVLARFFRFRTTPHYEPSPLPRDYNFERFMKKDEFQIPKDPVFERYLPKVDELIVTEPPRLGGKSNLPRELMEIEQIQKNVQPIDPLKSILETQSGRNEAWQSATEKSSTFVVERVDASLGAEPHFLLFTGRGEPLKFKGSELFRLAEKARTEWEAIHGSSKPGPRYTFEGRPTAQELDSAALSIAVGSGGRARMVRAPKAMEQLSSFRKIDPVGLGSVKIRKSGSRYIAEQSFSSGTIKITATSRELLVRILEAVRQLLVEFGLMSRDGVMLAKALSPEQKALLISKIRSQTETSLVKLFKEDVRIKQAEKGKKTVEGRATVEVRLGDEVTRWNFTDRADHTRRFTSLIHE